MDSNGLRSGTWRDVVLQQKQRRRPLLLSASSNDSPIVINRWTTRAKLLSVECFQTDLRGVGRKERAHVIGFTDDITPRCLAPSVELIVCSPRQRRRSARSSRPIVDSFLRFSQNDKSGSFWSHRKMTIKTKKKRFQLKAHRAWLSLRLLGLLKLIGFDFWIYRIELSFEECYTTIFSVIFRFRHADFRLIKINWPQFQNIPRRL